MGLCDMVGLKFGLCVIANFRKFRGTRDNGWLCGRGGNCGAVGYVLRHKCSVLLLFLCCILLFVRLKEFCLWMMKNSKKSCK